MTVRKLFPILLAAVLTVCIGCAAVQENTNTGSGDTEVNSAADRADDFVEHEESDSEPAVNTGDVNYTLKVVDQKGRRVQGVVVRVCNADACVMVVSDEDGWCELRLPSGVYDVLVLNVPDGYEVAGESIVAPSGGGEVVVPVKRGISG